jgi:biotin carboxyl carrier protein
MASEEVLAPMLGKILRLVAAPGSRVREDETVLVMEAMKMEIEVVAPRDGTITEVRVRPGDPVDAGAVVAVLE